MPKWAKNLKPFFAENGLKDDQIEPAVRQWREDSKILQGFIAKWVDKYELTEDMADLGHIEAVMEQREQTERDHTELVSVCEELVGHFEKEENLRNALRVLKGDTGRISQENARLKEEVAMLRKRRTLDRFSARELVVLTVAELIRRFVERVKKEVRGDGT